MVPLTQPISIPYTRSPGSPALPDPRFTQESPSCCVSPGSFLPLSGLGRLGSHCETDGLLWLHLLACLGSLSPLPLPLLG